MGLKITSKIYNIAFIFLIGAFIFMSTGMKMKDREIQKLNAENFTLNDKLKAKVQIIDGKVKVVYRYKDKIKYKNVYIPPESSGATIIIDKNDKVDIEYSKFGTTITPFIGLSYDEKFSPELGARLVYYSKFGAGVSASPERTAIFIDYRLDFGLIKNSSIGLFIGNNDKSGVCWHTFL